MKVVAKDKEDTGEVILELKPFWRCTNCGARVSSCGFQTPEDMNAFSWENGAVKHACRAGVRYAQCELVIEIDPAKMRKALGVKRAQGKPIQNKVDVQV